MRISTISVLLLILLIGAQANQMHLTKNQNKKNKKFKAHNNIKLKIEREDEPVATDSDEGEVVNVVQDEDGKVTAYKSPYKKTNENYWQKLAESHDTFESFLQAYNEKLLEDLTGLQGERDSKEKECKAYGVEIETLEAEVVKAEDYIAWLQGKITENVARIDKIFADRCEAHQVFIEYYKNAKLTLRMINFLKEAITNYSFVQVKQVGKILTQFMNPGLLNNKEALKNMLLELKQVDNAESYNNAGESLQDEVTARSDEEIGTKHVDGNRDNINVKDFESAGQRVLDDYKKEIIGILDQLKSDINNEIDRRQNDEIALNDTIVKFVTKIEGENTFLQTEIDNKRDAIIQANDQIQSLTYLQETCWGDLQWLDDEITAQNTIIDYVKNNEDIIKQEYTAYWLQKNGISAKTEKFQEGPGSIEIGQVQREPDPISVDVERVDDDDDDDVIGNDDDDDDVIGDDDDDDDNADDWKQGEDTKDLNEADPNVGIKIPSVGLDNLLLGLSWEAEIDLDAGVIFVDAEGNVKERVFWDNLKSFDDSVEHLGDAQSGDNSSGDDEQIQVTLSKVTEATQSLFNIISIYEDYYYFNNVENAQVNLYIGEEKFLNYTIDPQSNTASSAASGYIIIEFYRNQNDNGNWYIRPTNLWVIKDKNGTSARDATNTGYDDKIKSKIVADNSKGWVPGNSSTDLNSINADIGIRIPDAALSGLKMGLGWEVEADLDSNIIIANNEYLVTDRVYWYQKESLDGSITHLGDNRTGEGNGDDETIEFVLEKVAQESTHLFAVILVYDQGVYFDAVESANVTIYVQDSIFSTYRIQPNLAEKSYKATGYLLVEFYRNQQDSNNWYLRPSDVWVYTDQAGEEARDASNTGYDDAILGLKPLKSAVQQNQGQNNNQQEETQNTDTENWQPGDQTTNLNLVDKSVGLRIPESGLEGLSMGLGWKINADLDSGIIFADADKNVQDVVYWGQQISVDESVEHLGDNQEGGSGGDDETVTFNLSAVSESTTSLFCVVVIYTDYMYFENADQAYVNIYIQDQVFTNYELKPKNDEYSSGASGLILVEIYRNTEDEGHWYLRPSNIWVYKNLSGIEARVATNSAFGYALHNANQDLSHTGSWKNGDEPVNLPVGGLGVKLPDIAVGGLTVGLAWKTEGIDLDHSIAFADYDYNLQDLVYWNNMESQGVTLDNDNRTGEGDDIDDETSSIDLTQINSDIQHLFVVINIYDDGQFFGNVQGVTFRIYINGETFITYDIETNHIEGADESSGMLLLEIFKNHNDNGNWWIKSVDKFLFSDEYGNYARTASSSIVARAIAGLNQE